MSESDAKAFLFARSTRLAHILSMFHSFTLSLAFWYFSINSLKFGFLKADLLPVPKIECRFPDVCGLKQTVSELFLDCSVGLSFESSRIGSRERQRDWANKAVGSSLLFWRASSDNFGSKSGSMSVKLSPRGNFWSTIVTSRLVSTSFLTRQCQSDYITNVINSDHSMIESKH